MIGGGDAGEFARALALSGIEASAFASVSEHPEGPPPDVVVLVCEQAAGAAEAVAEARAGLPDTPIVLVLPENSLDGRQALSLGAGGILWDSAGQSAAAAAVAAAAEGLIVLPSSLRQVNTHRSLSTREKQVLAMLVLGYSNGEIAKKLFLTESTVKSHLATAYKKLGVASRNDAVALILETLGTGILAITDGERISI